MRTCCRRWSGKRRRTRLQRTLRAPSEDSVRLTNAINRGLEKPEHPEEVTALIMQGISARYACFPTQMTSTDILRLLKEKDYDQAIRYITITAENAVTVTFR